MNDSIELPIYSLPRDKHKLVSRHIKSLSDGLWLIERKAQNISFTNQETTPFLLEK